jgi:two-component system sensor histidine kinase/response regulator
LAALLAESDAEAGYVLDAEAALLKAAFGGSYRTLESAVRGFEYEAGLAALRASAGAAGIAI